MGGCVCVCIEGRCPGVNLGLAMKGKRGLVDGWAANKHPCGFSPFPPPQQEQGKLSPVTSSLPCSGPRAQLFLFRLQTARAHSCLLLFTFLDTPSLSKRAPCEASPESLPEASSPQGASPHCGLTSRHAMLSNCFVVTDSPLDEWTFRSHCPNHVPEPTPSPSLNRCHPSLRLSHSTPGGMWRKHCGL